MRELVETRRAEMDAELLKGQTRLQQLRMETTRVEQVILRIQGALVVLDELLTPPTTAVEPADNVVPFCTPQGPFPRPIGRAETGDPVPSEEYS